MNIFQMNFSASILIILIVLLRSVAHHKLPKGTFLILWEIAAIRLLVPFSVPIRFRYFTGLDKLNGLLTESTDVRPPNITTVIAEKITDNAMPLSVIKIVWLVGLCAGLLFFVILHIKNCREFRTSLPVENDFTTRWLREHSLRRPIQVRQIDRIKAPLTYGIFRPIILLPKNMEWTDEKQINFIFEHEYVHIRRFDTLRKMILSILLCAHWFNPLVWLMCILANRDIEMSCDEQVIRRLVKADRTEYARTLIDMEERKSGFSVVCNHFCKNATEERIEYIMKYKKASAVSIALTFMMIAGSATVFGAPADVPIQKILVDNSAVIVTFPNADGTLSSMTVDVNGTNVPADTSGLSDSDNAPSGLLPAGAGIDVAEEHIAKEQKFIVILEWTPAENDMIVALRDENHNVVSTATLSADNKTATLSVPENGVYNVYVGNPSEDRVNYQLGYMAVY